MSRHELYSSEQLRSAIWQAAGAASLDMCRRLNREDAELAPSYELEAALVRIQAGAAPASPRVHKTFTDWSRPDHPPYLEVDVTEDRFILRTPAGVIFRAPMASFVQQLCYMDVQLARWIEPLTRPPASVTPGRGRRYPWRVIREALRRRRGHDGDAASLEE